MASSLEVRAVASSVSLFWMRELRRWWKPMGVKAGAFGLRVEDDRVVMDDGDWWSEFVKGFIPVQFVLRIFQISLG